VRCVRCRSTWFAEPIAETVPESALVEAGGVPEKGAATAPVAEPNQVGAPEEAEKPGFDWSIAADDVKQTASEPAGRSAEASAGAELGQGAVDALFGNESAPVVEAEAPPLVPAGEPEAGPAVLEHAPVEHHLEPDNIETVAARRVAPARKRRLCKGKLPRAGMPVAIVATAAILMGLIVWRVEVVRFAPQTASLFNAIGLPVNLRGLVWQDVRTTGEVHEGVPVLIVEGMIANTSTRTVEVPRLRFALRSRAGHEIYAWTTVTGRSVLAPGETAAFRTRLASPPADGRDVIVRFFTRRDLLAGTR